MNKIKHRGFISIILFIALALAISTAESCKKTQGTPIPPTILFDQSASYVSHDTTVVRGATITVGVRTKATNTPLMQIIHYYNYYDNIAPYGVNVEVINIPEANRGKFDYNFTIKTNINVGTEPHSFRIVDKNNQWSAVYLEISTR
jgi:hypothetical protein